ncbi:GntR family transcriptional regulator [Saccharopolyspora shandongensis]|uniref:GntR family transcriptional regulator n=1 Tax=Saccharopolyspora shandongensis TaxID=418495 RepID=A0A1H3H6W1_9PSEU|nr:winged helix-turn-helix domain-containing protein [Saccharopolyspora shandongensis]SDY10504.1 GntR family transcriptional regulator [Saccharopolyspora shandongensis]
MGKVDPDDSRPPFQQVADDLRTAIRDGVLSPGARLPKHAELAEEYGVSVGTVKSALGTLRNESLIVSRQGEGSWVRRVLPETTAADAMDADARDVLAEILKRLDEVNDRLAAIEDLLPRSGR